MNRLASMLLFAIISSGCATEHKCEIKVTGTASQAMVTYMIGASQSQETVSLPWSHDFVLSDRYSPISVSAQNQGETGNVEIAIVADGRTLKAASATNAYGMATAATTLSDL